KNVLVTGGGNNIGRAIVLAFASEGCNVAIAELDHAAGKRVAAEVSALESGASAIVVDADVTDQARTVAMMNEAIDRLGSVDVLVNNVGWTIDRLFMDKSRDEHVKEVDVNLWGAINCIHAVLPHMIERQSGAIVSISSDAGRIGEYREAVYSACKAGVIALSKSLARENGRYGLRLNMVCPGLVVPDRSDLFTDDVLERVKRAYPLRRMGSAQEVANAVVFLASDAASFITGQTLSVSGGYTMM
ncbi:3-oxoacyl-[acyl-carrier-protein] reductase FabG, partial [Geodia barretti]